ncbi:splicing factor, suppressor of white-apricot homolog isoform X2 [Protopterus annectens]|uniref:splicing factor, suppressor of white-apricot homolog isoform X2 n=1 Tax=Protopterus annectens TaxID=7888 RepID=UPI001CF9AE2C|nr:splicing factor, suppressor of white-apricot homolog isoform X2 [Protopterus annectens]
MSKSVAAVMYGNQWKSNRNEAPVESTEGSTKVELLVFGYACKIFRDDEKALYHEHGKHLIPWMGDRKILIDRYDGRGHLHDLSEYDAEYTSWNRDYQLTEEEARIDALCDEERYLALHTDLLEEEARQEEEYRRLSMALADEGSYNEVGFMYTSDYYDPSQPTEEEDSQKETAEPETSAHYEEPFVAPAGLRVPPDVELPATVKTHAIIERTANFVCKQGTQFEIMLKAKQANNSQFDFLRFDHYLNPYYKYLLKVMKEGRYTPFAEKPEEKSKPPSDDDDEEEDDGEDCGYLHPSLFASKKSSRLAEIMKPLTIVDPDHPLAELVRKTKSEREQAALQAAENAAAQAAQMDNSTDPSVATVYYSYYMLPDGTYCLAAPPPGMDVATYYNALPAGMTVAATTGVATATSTVTATTLAADPASIDNGEAPSFPVASTLAPVAAIIPPPPDIQPVIDKLAQYVARNGIKFETSVRAKNDPRFEFLQPYHQYNAYYEFKKQHFAQKEGLVISQVVTPPHVSDEEASRSPQIDVPEESLEESEDVAEEQIDTDTVPSSTKPASDGKLVKASCGPISFAIKAKENDMLPLEKNRVKLYDDSEEEDGEGNEGQENGNATTNKEQAPAAPSVVEEKKPSPTLEELEARQAKQKLEDKLAAAAREKLAQAAKECKEKQLQAERKRKAALFLLNLKPVLSEMDYGKAEENMVVEEVSMNVVHSLQPRSVSLREMPPYAAGIPGARDRTAALSRHKTHGTKKDAACTVESSIVSSREQNGEKVSCSSTPSTSTFVGKVGPAAELKTLDRPASKSKGSNKEHEKEKKKKKHKKRSRSRSHSRKKDSHSKHSSPSRSRTKSKHSLPSAYRTVRVSRSRSRSPSKKRTRSVERRHEEKERLRNMPSSYRTGNSPVRSKKHSRSRSPGEKKKKKRTGSHSRSKPKSRSQTRSPSPQQYSNKNSGHSASISPVESRESSQDRSRGGSQEKDEVSSAIVSSVQSKITQDLMAKVRAMLAATKHLETNAS